MLAFLYETGKIAAPADINMIDITDANRLNANVVRLKVKPRFWVANPGSVIDCRWLLSSTAVSVVSPPKGFVPIFDDATKSLYGELLFFTVWRRILSMNYTLLTQVYHVDIIYNTDKTLPIVVALLTNGGWLIVAISFDLEIHGSKNGSAVCTDLANIIDKLAEINIVMHDFIALFCYDY